MAWWGKVLKRIKKAFGYGGGVRWQPSGREAGRLPYKQRLKKRSTLDYPKVGGGRVIGRTTAPFRTKLPTGPGSGREWKDIFFGTQMKGMHAEPVAFGPAFGAVDKIGKLGKFGASTKAVGLTKNILSKVFSKKTLAMFGAWAGSVTIGLWATAEAPESIAFPETKFLITEAERTGDWSLVDEAEAAKAEILDLKLWEKIVKWSPASFLLITKKIQGAKAGAQIMSRIIEDKKYRQEHGLSEADMWAKINEDKAAQERSLIDHYNEQRRLMVEWEREAQITGRNEDAAFWRKQREELIELEAMAAEVQAKFWLEYRKELYRMERESVEEQIRLWEEYKKKWEEQRPSQLGFGLL